MGIKKFVAGIFSTNTYLITKNKKAVIVDPGLSFITLIDEIKDYEIEAVLITHGHIDHIDGIGLIDAPIYMGINDVLNLTDYTLSLYHMMDMKPSYDIKKLKIIPVKDNDLICLDDFTFRVIETPGHTRGGVCYLYYHNLFSGDTLFRGSVGRTDFPGGDSKALNSSLKKLIKALPSDTIIYPGHDEITDLKREKKENVFLKSLF